MKNAKADDAIDVLKGSVNLKLTTGGVKVTNSGGSVIVNNQEVKQNDTVTTSDRDVFGKDKAVRYAGATRYDTALKTADALKKSLGVDAFDNIIVADGTNYPDALAGNYLAKTKNAPLILVNHNAESEKMIKDYIDANLAKKGTVYILGGTGAVASSFEKSLKDFDVKRLGGSSRYDTNIEILKEASVNEEDLLVCTGEDFADSLSASAAGKPILLTAKSGINNTQKKYLDTLKTKDIYLIGGTGVISEKISEQMKSYDQDKTVDRVAGDTRYLTSVAVAKKFCAKDSETVVLAYAQNFPDGLSGGPLALSLDAPLLLVDQSNHQAAADYAKNAGIKKAVVLGGPSLISDDIISKIVQ